MAGSCDRGGCARVAASMRGLAREALAPLRRRPFGALARRERKDEEERAREQH
jgi:hypothetical protein